MENIPTSVDSRKIVVAGITLRMHFLDDGRRVVEGPGMDAFIRACNQGRVTQAEALRAARWVKGDA